jgi:hypothetical protein
MRRVISVNIVIRLPERLPAYRHSGADTFLFSVSILGLGFTEPPIHCGLIEISSQCLRGGTEGKHERHLLPCDPTEI